MIVLWTHQTCLSKVICFSVNFGFALLLMTDRGRLKSPHHACQSAVYETVSNFDQVIKTIFEKFLHSWSSQIFFFSLFFFFGNYDDVFIVIKFTEFPASTFVKKCVSLFILPGICHCLWLKKKEWAQEHFSDVWQDWQLRNTTWHPWDPEWQGKDGQWSVIYHTQKKLLLHPGWKHYTGQSGMISVAL